MEDNAMTQTLQKLRFKKKGENMENNEIKPTWHTNFIFKDCVSDVCNVEGESVTDKSDFRPDIASVRDKAIALAKTGGGRVGLYDTDNGQIDQNTLNALAYARGMSRDITEIESAKKYLSNYIENAKEEDKQNLKNEMEKKKLLNTFKEIAENTKKVEETTK